VPVDDDLDAEDLLVVGADGLEEAILRATARDPLGVLLEPALGALEGGRWELGSDLRLGDARHPGPGHVPAGVEEDRPDDGLEGRGEE